MAAACAASVMMIAIALTQGNANQPHDYSRFLARNKKRRCTHSSKAMRNKFDHARESMLWMNAKLLEQAVQVLTAIDDAAYVKSCELFDGQRIGSHVRHVIDFYESLLNGLSEDAVDYDARKRDPVIESNRQAAIRRLRILAVRLMEDVRLRDDRNIWVNSEASACYAYSSLARELQVVCSHTVHHFALIAVLLHSYGLAVPPDFGVSNSTARFRALRNRTEAA